MPADARVAANPPAHERNIGAHLFAEVGDLIHERDTGRKHRVRSILRQFGGRDVHEDQWVAGTNEGRIQLRHSRGGPI